MSGNFKIQEISVIFSRTIFSWTISSFNRERVYSSYNVIQFFPHYSNEKYIITIIQDDVILETVVFSR